MCGAAASSTSASKCRADTDLGGDAGVVERVDLVVADEQVAAAGALLDLLQLLAQPCVVAEEVVAGLPVALDERVPDEQLAGQLAARPSRSRRDGAAPAAARRASPARRPSPRRVGRPSAARCSVRCTRCPATRSTTSGSMRAAIRPYSLLVSTRSATTIQRGGRLVSTEPGREHELRVACAGVVARVAFAQADMRQQPGDQRGVHLGRVGGLLSSDSRMPMSRAMLRNWPARSCHSRMRR